RARALAHTRAPPPPGGGGVGRGRGRGAAAGGGGAGAGSAASSRPALRIGEVAGLLGVRTSALRVWEAAGLLTPRREHGTGYRLFDPADVRDARLVHTLRGSHYLFDRIRPVLDGLRREGSSEALRAALVARGEALTARTRAMLEGAGALHTYLGSATAAGSGGGSGGKPAGDSAGNDEGRPRPR
ncbi:MerR family transcriptional regulator, partial [Streptomyces prasinus]|uniref:MerR family transcriptional regulator n=1 Tax=Streptomyces prasinus TaxID=67345 RepID=UPI003645A4DD